TIRVLAEGAEQGPVRGADDLRVCGRIDLQDPVVVVPSKGPRHAHPQADVDGAAAAAATLCNRRSSAAPRPPRRAASSGVAPARTIVHASRRAAPPVGRDVGGPSTRASSVSVIRSVAVSKYWAISASSPCHAGGRGGAAGRGARRRQRRIVTAP